MQNLSDLVRNAARAAPGRAALIVGGDSAGDQRLTWAELDARVDAMAVGLGRRGLTPGDRVALLLGNTPEFVITYFGALRAGLVALPVHTGYTGAELRRVIADARPGLVVYDERGAEAVAAAQVPALAVGSPEYAELASRSPTQPVDSGRGGEDLAVLGYTAGTTGEPKAAMLSHRALLANLEQCARIDPPPLAGDDVVLIALPLFHLYALNTALGGVAHMAATAVLVDRFDPDETLRLVRRHGVTNIPGVPGMYASWLGCSGLREALASVRLLVSGAVLLPPAMLKEWITVTGQPVFEGYGLTEAAPVLTSTLCTGKVKPGSVGRALPGIELRLVDEDGDDVDEGDPGEIVVRGANLFSGYWPDGSGGPDPDGWFRTGDVAYADEDGDLFLVDRRKELIIVNGFNVYPSEVEEAIREHPDVAEAAVIGVPDPATGEVVTAYVVPRPGAELTAEDVLAHCAGRLARFKSPSHVRIVSDLPRSTTGKIAKGRLRARERARRPEEDE
ncbi:AMP-binding protein [Carbonactinospora thermoautotrophica]|uniref:AMP-binding protein n=1 Tax=Carbonactinospora thermoautotrophica TaxID=1469144 RepID=UPI0022712571|nr:AMP-binding protein [Carbonactinospora thermoautotrophica]